MMLAFGLGFEFPIVLVALQMIGVVTPAAALELASSDRARHRDPRRRDHALGRPLLARGTRHADVPVLRAERAARTSAGASPQPDTGSRRGRGLSRHLRPRLPARPVPAGGDRRPWTVGATSWSPHPPERARRSSPSTRWRSRSSSGRKCFYTAPIKALSNQKFGDLRRELGDESVGLLTGDHSINSDAPVVVMTTEVLRNMVYAGSSALDGLGWVVLDEVHFLQDAYRGPVWEEVLVHTPRGRRASCACPPRCRTPRSWATGSRRCADRPTRSSSTSDPIRLDPLMLVGDRSAEREHLVPLLVHGRPEPRGPPLRRRPPGAAPAGPGDARGPASSRRAGSRPSNASTTRACCRRSTSSSAATAATRRPGSCMTAGCGSPTPPSGPGSVSSPSTARGR